MTQQALRVVVTVMGSQLSEYDALTDDRRSWHHWHHLVASLAAAADAERSSIHLFVLYSHVVNKLH